MFPNKGGNLRTRPVEERMDFDQIVCVVDRGKRYAGAFVRLVRAKPGDPRGGARKSPAKQLDFTDGTAGLPPLDRIEEPIDALAGDQRFNAYVIGIERRNSAAVLPFRLSPELIGLRKQTSRIERHHLNLKGLPEYRMRDRLALKPEARGEYDPASHKAADCRHTLHQVAIKARFRKRKIDGARLMTINHRVGHGAPLVVLFVRVGKMAARS